MSKSLREALIKLANDQSECLGSRFTPRQKRALDDFLHRTPCIARERKGNGSLYRITDQTVFQQHLSELRPEADSPTDEAPARAQNLALTRSSKGRQSAHQSSYRLLRATAPGVVWNSDETTVDLWEITKTVGALAIDISQTKSPLRTNGPLWLVENQALFDDISWVPEGLHGSVLYYQGQISERLMAWLQARVRSDRILLFPDYDGVGLQNYARMRQALGDKIELWLMPDWKRKLHRYGDSDVWRNTLEYFSNAQILLMKGHEPHEVTDFLETLKLSGRALEQEAVFLKTLWGK